MPARASSMHRPAARPTWLLAAHDTQKTRMGARGPMEMADWTVAEGVGNPTGLAEPGHRRDRVPLRKEEGLTTLLSARMTRRSRANRPN